MLIQNVTANSAPAPSAFGSTGTPAVSIPATGSAPAELPQVAVPAVSNAHAAQPGNAQQPTDAQLQSAVDKLNRSMQQSNTNLQFSIDNASKRTLVKVIDAGTGETIKQFPSKEVLAISEAIDQFQKGMLLRQKA
jgi:flagellar protein FlaG